MADPVNSDALRRLADDVEQGWTTETSPSLRAAADQLESLEEQVQTLLAATRTYEDGFRKALINGSSAWDAGYSAAKAQYSGYGIDLNEMAGAMYTATSALDAVAWEDLVDNLNEYMLTDVVDQWRCIAKSALNYIEKQADA